MVALPQPVDVEKQAGQGGNSVLIPQGKYQSIIVNSEMKATKTGGQMIVFTFVITQGQYADTEFTKYINIVNKNPKTVEIGYQEIANIGKAAGVAKINDSSELHNKPLMIEVKTIAGKDWVDDNGKDVEGKDKSEIKKYHPLPAAGVQATADTPPIQSAADDAPDQVATDKPPKNPFAAKAT